MHADDARTIRSDLSIAWKGQSESPAVGVRAAGLLLCKVAVHKTAL